MRTIFLTADDPLYLPEFFDRVLACHSAETVAVYATPPLYKSQSPWAAAWRYFRSFGAADTIRLSLRVARARMQGRSIEAVCRKYGVAQGVAEDVNAPAFLERLRGQAPEVIVSVSCPQVFRRPLMDLPPRGLLNVHGAILPDYRGVMPGFWMLANGEKRAGVSVHFVAEQVDSGSLCGQEIFEIDPTESLDAFLRRSKRIAADLLLAVLASLEAGTVQRRPLDSTAGSYHSWPTRAAVDRFRAAGRRVW